MSSYRAEQPMAWFDGRLATGLRDQTDDPAALDSAGWWAVVATFEGTLTCARFREVAGSPLPGGRWHGPRLQDWSSSMDQEAYVRACVAIRGLIAAGEVYQVNLCRVLSAPLAWERDLLGLAQVLAAGNPAPYAGVVRLPGLDVVTASPELFVRRDGAVVSSGPIKGTASTPAQLLPKDRAENVMIVDLVRNDLGQVCETGSVTVPELCAVQRHPGLVHLVSTVQGRLRPEVGWGELLGSLFPPGSVSGAPKSSALAAITALEPGPRGPYCGAVGWVDADRRTAVLAVGIRTFWTEGHRLLFGTGAGVTWGSDPHGEWRETELKARRLIALASEQGAPRC